MFACAAFSSETRHARVASLAVCTYFIAQIVIEKMHTHKQKLVYRNNDTATAVALRVYFRKTNLISF